MTSTLIIAEAGVNHNGSLDMARRLVAAAAAAGADFVKFQTFVAEKSISLDTQKAAYQKRTTGADETMLEMVKKFELPLDDFKILAAEAQRHGIGFLSTPFDLESVVLLNGIGVPLHKIPSGEITNAPLLLAMARSGVPLLMSTGMATLADVEQALGILAFGLTGQTDDQAGEAAFRQAFISPQGQDALARSVTLLHCTTEYPARLEDTNLRAMDSLAAAFGLKVGYSDHTLGIVVPVAAVARGAVVIEKHFTLDKSLPGPDHTASLDPTELTAMVAAIRQVESALGHGRKLPSPIEQANALVARKSLVAARPVAKGTVLTVDDLAVKRPGDGLSPVRFYDMVGRVATRDYRSDEQIQP